MKKIRESIDKRKSRSEVLFDLDDLLVLSILNNSYEKSKERIDKKIIREHEQQNLPLCLVKFENIKKDLNMSYNSLLVHLKRLYSHNFITIARSPNNYKFKVAGILKEGIYFLNLMQDSPKAKQILIKYGMNKVMRELGD